MDGNASRMPVKKTVNATMNDVAAAAGVSLKTVSNVVNDYPHVSRATRERVETAIRELGYKVNFTAQNLRLGRTGLIGLAVPELSAPYFGELAQELTVEAQRHGLSIVVELTGDNAKDELGVLSGPRRGMTDGILFSPVHLTSKDIGSLNIEHPLVLLGERIFGAPTDHVTMNNVEGSRAVTRYLFERGARRIALLGYEESTDSSAGMLRTQGYMQALEDVGLPVNDELLLPAPKWDRSMGAAVISEALRRGVEFDAVFGVVDVLAIGALHSLHLGGYLVPEDVQVAGFDNVNESAYTNPPLTSVNPGMREIAKTALEMLVAQISKGKDGVSRVVYAPFEIVKRGSTR